MNWVLVRRRRVYSDHPGSSGRWQGSWNGPLPHPSLGGAHGRQLGGEACRIGETVEEAPVEVVQQVVLETGDARTQDAGHVGRVLGTVDEPVHGDVTAHAVMHEVGPVGDLGGEGGTVEERLVEVGDVG